MVSRIKQLIEMQGLSVRAFALSCKITQATLDRQLKGLRELSLDTTLKILAANPNLSSEWLLRGNGPMFISDILQQNNDRLSKLTATIGEMQSIIEENKLVIDELVKENEKLKKQPKK